MNVPDPPLYDDPLWPRAGDWLSASSKRQPAEDSIDLAMVGVPACRTSITPTNAHLAPSAIRHALYRYSTYSGSRDIDVSRLHVLDLGDVDEPDGAEGEECVRKVLATGAERCELLVALGGDNSITYSVMRAVFGEDLRGHGLVTVDAHHDLRDGESNGSPVRRLIQSGLQGEHIVQMGIADFANSAAYAQRARDQGVRVICRSEFEATSLNELVVSALEVAGEGGRPVYVDLDVDVCDRSVAPGCPASLPGGISAQTLRELAYLFARDPRVRAMDIAEIDPSADATDQRTVRLGALLVLEIAAGLCERLESTGRAGD